MSWKQTITHETKEFLAVLLFLAPFFLAFSTYRMMVLNDFEDKYFAYGSALVKAFVFAKIILIGEYARLGKRQEDKPLIVSSIWKAFLFSLLVAAFHVLEDSVRGLLHGEDLAAAFREVSREDWRDLLARILVVFCAFIPFFSLREVGRVMGQDKLYALFFRRSRADLEH
jgi:hypothetical protein